MQQVVEVLALGCGVECSLIPLRGDMGMDLFFTPLCLSKWASFYVVRFQIHIMLEEE